MFVYSLKGTTLKFVLFLAAVILILVLVVIFVPGKSPGDLPPESTYTGISDEDDRISLLESFGYEVEANAFEVCEISLPKKFNDAYRKYNELQAPLGLDLSAYCGKTVIRYTYVVTNYSYDGTVYANLLIYDDTFIGGDFSSAKLDGFMTSLGTTPQESE